MQFLEEEIKFVLSKINPGDSVLDLGCGYGRVAIRLAEKSKEVVGIDISQDNIKLAKQMYKSKENLVFKIMNAADLKFPRERFDVIICIQNGISAFKIDPQELIGESLRVTKTGGILLMSSYSDKFWEKRLNWFELQAKEGLIGEIDYEKTGNGIIVCQDGFTATTYREEDFKKITRNFNVEVEIYEVDNSTVFCEMKKR
ncbi:MAG: class I SAM-dependent methyltransferase [bacterium]